MARPSQFVILRETPNEVSVLSANQFSGRSDASLKRTLLDLPKPLLEPFIPPPENVADNVQQEVDDLLREER